GTGEAVRRIARTGGAGEIVAGGFGPGDLEALTIVDGTVVYATARELWRITATGPQLIAGGLDLSSELTGAAGFLYAGTGPSERISSVFRVPLAGGTPQPIATMLANPSGIAVDGHTAYFTDRWPQRVSQLPAAGGAVTVLVDGDRGSGGIVARGGRLYYASAFGAHATLRELAPGGEPITIHRGERFVGPVGDGTGVFWFDGDRLFAR